MEESGKHDLRKPHCARGIWVTIAGMLCISALIAVGVYFGVTRNNATPTPAVPGGQNGGGHNPEKPNSAAGTYARAAVTSDTNICAAIGKDLLQNQEGSAVDAAIAVAVCSCTMNQQYCGIGGGHFATIYERPRNSSEREVMTVTARERAPLAATADMFVNNSGASTFGGSAVGVPGEISGYYQAWRRYGRVPWKNLFLPSIAICEQGFRVEWDLSNQLKENEPYIRNDTNLGYRITVLSTSSDNTMIIKCFPEAFNYHCVIRTGTQNRDSVHVKKLISSELYIHPNGSLLKEGDVLINKKLGQTLKRISEDPETFYKGSLADDIIADLSEYGSIITKQDLETYFTEAANFTFKPPVKITLKNGNYDIYSVPPPSSGAVLEFILNILDGYNMTKEDISTVDKKALTYHRMVEAFKFAYAKRSQLGDNRYVDVSELVFNLTSCEYAESIRQKIADNTTHDVLYYEPLFEYKPDSGTASYNVLAPDGGAVVLTSTINTGFGSKIRGRRTGIVFNNEMDDFSTPGTVNAWGVPASPTNFVQPGKMPQSSISPTIVLKGTHPVLLAGTAGGTRITTTTSFIAINTLWLGVGLKETMDQPRFHHQLVPNHVEHESWLDKNIVKLLKQRGHQTVVPSLFYSVSASIINTCSEEEWSRAGSSELNCVTAVQDGRRGGVPKGF